MSSFVAKPLPAAEIIVAASNADARVKATATQRCTGVADQVAIANAITEAGTGGKVVLPKGNYYLSDELTIPSDITITGGGTLTQSTADKNVFILAAGTSNVIIDGLTIIANDSNGFTTSCGIYMPGTAASRITGITISDCDISNFAGAGIYCAGGQNIVISGNRIHDAATVPFSAVASEIILYGESSRNVIITGNILTCDVSQGIAVGAFLEATDSNVIITDNYIDVLDASGDYVDAPSYRRHCIAVSYGWTERSIIANNFLARATWTGVYAACGSNPFSSRTSIAKSVYHTIHGNTIYRCANNSSNGLGGGIMTAGYVEKLSIHDNMFIEVGDGETSIGAINAASNLGEQIALTIKNNTIIDANTQGIALRNNCQQINCHDNTIINSTFSGISVGAGHSGVAGTIKNNRINQVTDYPAIIVEQINENYHLDIVGNYATAEKNVEIESHNKSLDTLTATAHGFQDDDQIYIIGNNMPTFVRGSFTGTAVDDTLTFGSAHGRVDGDPVYVTGASLPTGISKVTKYYVRDSATLTLKLAETLGGAAVNLTANGTGDLLTSAFDMRGVKLYVVNKTANTLQLSETLGGSAVDLGDLYSVDNTDPGTGDTAFIDMRIKGDYTSGTTGNHVGCKIRAHNYYFADNYIEGFFEGFYSYNAYTGRLVADETSQRKNNTFARCTTAWILRGAADGSSLIPVEGTTYTECGTNISFPPGIGGLAAFDALVNDDSLIVHQSTRPTRGTWAVGDLIINPSASNKSDIGWVCTTAGAIGTAVFDRLSAIYPSSADRFATGQYVAARYNARYQDATDYASDNDGTWNGTPAYADAPNLDGYAFATSSGNYIALPNDILEGATEWTIMGRIYATTLTGNESPFIGGLAGLDYPAIRWLSATGKLQVYWSVTPTVFLDFVSLTTISTGTWYHVAIRYDGTNGSILLDGVDDTGAKATEVAGGVMSTSSIARIGGGYTGSSVAWDGRIADVRLLNKALPDATILSIAGE